ncbi:MogA/MoaB family molybdenum cofactor biosynthesis protein [Bacillaceae bacterium]
MWKVGIITASDSVYRGERQDDSAKILSSLVHEHLDCEILAHRVVPDSIEDIKETMIELVDREKVDLLLTTGGTGLSPRDVTPEATRQVIDRYIPGIAEEMRRGAMGYSRKAMLTRAIAGTRGNTLIINFPGSPRAVEECFTAIADQIPDALLILQGTAEGPSKEEVW